jgi:hypothetical protein
MATLIKSVMMGTELVPKTFENINHLTWLMAREDFINVSPHERFVSYKFTIAIIHHCLTLPIQTQITQRGQEWQMPTITAATVGFMQLFAPFRTPKSGL